MDYKKIMIRVVAFISKKRKQAPAEQLPPNPNPMEYDRIRQRLAGLQGEAVRGTAILGMLIEPDGKKEAHCRCEYGGDMELLMQGITVEMKKDRNFAALILNSAAAHMQQKKPLPNQQIPKRK